VLFLSSFLPPNVRALIAHSLGNPFARLVGEVIYTDDGDISSQPQCFDRAPNCDADRFGRPLVVASSALRPGVFVAPEWLLFSSLRITMKAPINDWRKPVSPLVATPTEPRPGVFCCLRLAVISFTLNYDKGQSPALVNQSWNGSQLNVLNDTTG
jgi:hypothetical protein